GDHALGAGDLRRAPRLGLVAAVAADARDGAGLVDEHGAADEDLVARQHGALHEQVAVAVGDLAGALVGRLQARAAVRDGRTLVRVAVPVGVAVAVAVRVGIGVAVAGVVTPAGAVAAGGGQDQGEGEE